MKKLILSIIFATMGLTLFAQQYGDTIQGKQPNYYYNFWYEDWRDSVLPTDTCYLEWGQIIDSVYMGSDGLEHMEYHYGWIKMESDHRIYMTVCGGTGDLRWGDGGEMTSGFYSSKPLKILGFATLTQTMPNPATPTGEWFEPHDMPDSNEYFVLYDEIAYNMVRKKAVPWHIPENSRFIKLGMHYNLSNHTLGCEDQQDTDIVFPWYEYYFDTAVYVCDNFFLGKTSYSYYNYYTHYFQTNVLTYPHTLTGLASIEAGHNDPLCPAILLDYRCRAGANINDNSHPWTTFSFPRSFLIYPIFEVACPEAYGLRETYASGGQHLLAWDTSRYQTSWEIAYAPEGTSVEDATIVGALSPQLQLNGLDSTLTYRVWLRSKCVYDTTFYSEWTDSILLSPSSPVAIANLDALSDGLIIAPNPATNKVNVTSSSPIDEVALFNLEGERVVRLNGTKSHTLTLDISALPAGTYLAKIHTPQGSFTKKLVVQ